MLRSRIRDSSIYALRWLSTRGSLFTWEQDRIGIHASNGRFGSPSGVLPPVLMLAARPGFDMLVPSSHLRRHAVLSGSK